MRPDPHETHSVCIVLVNWNAGDQIKACLDSVAAAGRAGFDVAVVVVDNGSTDGSADFLKAANPYPDLPVTLVEAGENLGFGRGCNLGAAKDAEARGRAPDFVLFLNPDTEVRPDTFQKLAATPDLTDPEIGILGVQMVDETGRVQHTCSNFPTAANFAAKLTGLNRLFSRSDWAQHHMTAFDHQSDRTVDQVMGAFFMVRGALFQDLGGFDPQFFVYFEEVDFARRAKAAGFTSRFLAGPQIFHRAGGTTESVKGFRQYLSVSSRLRYFRKHSGPGGRAAIWALSFVIEPLARIARLGLRGRLAEIGDLLGGYRQFLVAGVK